MKALSTLFLIAGIILCSIAAYTFLLESSPAHTPDYFGFVFTLGCGVPGIILFALGILFLKKK